MRPTFEERLEAVEEAVGAAIGAVVVTEADDGDLDAVALRRLGCVDDPELDVIEAIRFHSPDRTPGRSGSPQRCRALFDRGARATPAEPRLVIARSASLVAMRD